jgi:hypothetical protein
MSKTEPGGRPGTRLEPEQQNLAKRMFLPLRPYEAFRYEIGRDGGTILSRKPAHQC